MMDDLRWAMLVMWLMAAMMAVYVARHPVYDDARLSLRQRFFEPATIFYMFRIGLPVGLSIFFEVSIFAVGNDY